MMNPILQQFANRPTALQHVEHAPFQQQNPLELLVAALSGLHRRPVDPGLQHPAPMGPLHHPPAGSATGNPHHGELSIDLSPHHQEIGLGGGGGGLGGFGGGGAGGMGTEPLSGLPHVLPAPEGPAGSHGEIYTPPIRRRPELAQAFYGTSVHPVGMV